MDIEGFDEFAEELDGFAEELREFESRLPGAIDDGVETTAREVESDTSKNAPKDTGRLANSYESNRIGLGKWEVGTDVEYARPVEFGSEPHLITPNGDYPLRFFWEKIGAEVALNYVNHPGTPAQPHLRPALRENTRRLQREIDREITQLAREIFKANL